MKLKIIFIIIIFTSIFVFGFNIPEFKTNINDFGFIFNKVEENKINDIIEDLEKRKKININITTLLKTNNIDINELSNNIIDQLNIENKNINNLIFLSIIIDKRNNNYKYDININLGKDINKHLSKITIDKLISKSILREINTQNYFEAVDLFLSNIDNNLPNKISINKIILIPIIIVFIIIIIYLYKLKINNKKIRNKL